MKRKLLMIGISLAAILFVTFLILRRDEAPPDVSDFRVVRRSVPADRNGFEYLRLEYNPRHEITDDEEGDGEDEEGGSGPQGRKSGPSLFTNKEWDVCDPLGPEWDPKVARKVVERCQEALSRIDKALEMEDFLAPEHERIDQVKPYLHQLRECSFLLTVRAGLRIEDGTDREGFQDALLLVRLGHAIERAQGGAVFSAYGMNAKIYGLRILLLSIERSKLPVVGFHELFQSIEAMRPNRTTWIEMVKIDTASYFEIIDLIAAGKEIPEFQSVLGFLFKPNATKRMLAENSRPWLGDELWKRPVGKLRDESTWMRELSGINNLYGKRLLMIITPGFSSVFRKFLLEDFLTSAVRVQWALKAYKESKGELPESLAQLVPAFLEKVPEDLSDGKPLRYSREKKILWSVGQDLEDAGGSDDPDASELLGYDEPTVRIGF